MSHSLHLIDSHLVRNSNVNLYSLFDEMRDYFDSLGEDSIRTIFLNSNGIKNVVCDLSIVQNEDGKNRIQQSLKKLSWLHLNENEFEVLDFTLLNHLTGLQYLNLSHNRLSSLVNAGTTGFATLKVMDLSFNHLKNLQGISKCFNLRELLVDHNSLSSMDSLKDVFQLSELVTFDFRDNHISETEATTIFHKLVTGCPKLSFLNGTMMKTQINLKTKRKGVSSMKIEGYNSSEASSHPQSPSKIESLSSSSKTSEREHKLIRNNSDPGLLPEGGNRPRRGSLQTGLLNDQKLLNNLAVFAAKKQLKKTQTGETRVQSLSSHTRSNSDIVLRTNRGPSEAQASNLTPTNFYSESQPVIHEDEDEEAEYLSRSDLTNSKNEEDVVETPSRHTLEQNITVQTTKRYIVQQSNNNDRVEFMEQIETRTVHTPTFESRESFRRESFSNESRDNPEMPSTIVNGSDNLEQQIKRSDVRRTRGVSEVASLSRKHLSMPHSLQLALQSSSMSSDQHRSVPARNTGSIETVEPIPMSISSRSPYPALSNSSQGESTFFPPSEQLSLNRAIDMKELARTKMKEKLKSIAPLDEIPS